MQQKASLVLFLLLMLPGAGLISAQEYRISNFGISEGIPYEFVYTVNQDSHGYIWVGTGEGLCRFDGFDFSTAIIQDSLAGMVAAVSYKDSRQDLWFGYHSGSIARFSNRKFELVETGMEINGAVTGFAGLADGSLLVSTLNNGLLLLDAEDGKAQPVEGVAPGNFTSLLVAGNTLLLGAQEGLFVYSIEEGGQKVNLKSTVAALEFSRIQDIQPSAVKDVYWIATEDEGLMRLVLQGEKHTLSTIGETFNVTRQKIQAVYEDAEGRLWISTLTNGVYRLGNPDGQGNFESVLVLNTQKGLPTNAIKKIFEDREGNMWIATYGKGLTLLTGQPLVFTRFDEPGFNNDIQSLAAVGDNIYYLGCAQGLFRYDKTSGKGVSKVGGLPADKVTALYHYENTLLIGTEKNGLYTLNMFNASVRKVSYEAYSMGNWVSAIAADDQHVYIGTKDGIFQFTGDLKPEAQYTTNNGLPHNNIEHVFTDSKNRLLIATRANGIYHLSPDGKIENLYPTGNSEVEFRSIAEDPDGGIWAGTYGDGVVYFNNDTIFQFNTTSGLKANYCYSIVKGAAGSMWVGHRLGMSRINTHNMHISIYDQHVGITGDCNPNAAICDKNGVTYMGTTNGLVSYDPGLDKSKKLPPVTNIVSVLIADKYYDISQPVILPYQAYKMKIEFIGLNYSDPEVVRYQYKLDGYDPDWSEVTSSNIANYSRIEDGEYTFMVRSFNSEGISEESPVTFRIIVKPPIWKRWWFITLMVLITALALFGIIKFRERKQKMLQEYLERELAKRTKEVVEQKEEIEIKNRDITDSINYAKRIQTSMLPPIKRLQQHFSGSFVFYSPRDIVSGDFYWFDKVNDSKFTIVCADSTGHGVPGAFMSMIGSTLIKDICNRETGNSPSKVLQVLDCELRNTLNQNLDDGTKPGDGMDIIVCEIDLKTHYVRYASAMRPMIIYRNGEEVFIKGSRNSVGGHYDREENLFEDEGIQLSKGDIIYMFSDGYSDQFGGPMGKKFKMVRLKNLLQDIHTKPMDEQCMHVKNTFNLWKENYEQVDDVLFMGIKI